MTLKVSEERIRRWGLTEGSMSVGWALRFQKHKPAPVSLSLFVAYRSKYRTLTYNVCLHATILVPDNGLNL